MSSTSSIPAALPPHINFNASVASASASASTTEAQTLSSRTLSVASSTATASGSVAGAVSPTAGSQTASSTLYSFPDPYAIASPSHPTTSSAGNSSLASPHPPWSPQSATQSQAGPSGTNNSVTGAGGHARGGSLGGASLHSTLPSTSSQRAIADARTALVASVSNLLDTELQSRAAALHQGEQSIKKQERDVAKATEALRKENDKLAKVVADVGHKIKETGNVQNWAEVLEREFLVLEETVRLVKEGYESSECSCSDCGREYDSGTEGESDERDEVVGDKKRENDKEAEGKGREEREREREEVRRQEEEEERARVRAENEGTFEERMRAMALDQIPKDKRHGKISDKGKEVVPPEPVPEPVAEERIAENPVVKNVEGDGELGTNDQTDAPEISQTQDSKLEAPPTQPQIAAIDPQTVEGYPPSLEPLPQATDPKTADPLPSVVTSFSEVQPLPSSPELNNAASIQPTQSAGMEEALQDAIATPLMGTSILDSASTGRAGD